MEYIIFVKNLILVIYNYLLITNALLPFCALISLFVLLIVVIKFSLKPTPVIENFMVAWISLLIYISIYIIFFFWLRFYRLGYSLNLKILFDEFSAVFISNDLLIPIIRLIYLALLVVVIGLWIVLIIKLRLILGDQIWRLYIYYNYMSSIKNSDLVFYQEQGSLVRLFIYKYFSYFNEFFFTFLRYEFVSISINNVLNSLFLKYTGHHLTSSPQIYVYLIRYMPTILFVIILLIEVYFNKFILYYTFYYLLVYLFLVLYLQISETINWYHNHPLSKVLVERAYLYPEIIYINLTDFEDGILIGFMLKANEFRELPKDTRKGNSFELKRYELVEVKTLFPEIDQSIVSGYLYYNQSTGCFFGPDILRREDIDHFIVNENEILSIILK